MVFYRKYRPQTISELDSTQVRETLTAVLASKEIPHAFLFTGPKGLGKTSTARIIAKAVNCLHPKKGEPCNACEMCVSITNGSNMDILEIDGASNRGIDEIRDLRERVKLAPSNSLTKKKIYIIDEVHMLTTEAFNALLKTIEEPPPHVMFIFCTTEPQKIPATIISRCFHIAFALAAEDEIVHALERIKNAEQIEIGSEELHTIAQMSEGGFRDGVKMFEELVLLHGKKITKEHFQNKTTNTLLKVQTLFAYLAEKNEKGTKNALKIVSDVINEGLDLRFFIYQLLSFLHEKLLEEMGVKEKPSTKVKQFSITDIQFLTELFSKAYQDAKLAVIAQLPLEIAIIQWAQLQGGKSEQKNVHVGKPNIESLVKQQQAMKVKNVLYPTPSQNVTTEKNKSDDTSAQNDIGSVLDEKASLMENVIYKVKPYNHSVAGVLRGCKISSITDTEIIFETPYKFHKERLEEKKTCEIIEKAIKEITGKNLKVSVQLKNSK